MPNNKLTNEEIAQLLIDFELADVFYFSNTESFAIYKDGYFETLSTKGLHTQIHHGLRALKKDRIHSSFNITASVVKDISQQILWMLPEYKNKHVIDFSKIVFTDKVLDTKSFDLLDHDKEHNAFIHFPFSFESLKDQKEPEMFLKFLDEATQGDACQIDFIQTMMGYLFSGTNKAQVAFFMVGDGGTGKSVLLEVCMGLFPESIQTSVSLADLTSSNFRTSSLVGKHFNFVAEQAPKFQSSERFKQIVTGDKMNVERKFETAFDFRPNVIIISAVNQLPIFDRTDNAISRRFWFMPFDYIVPEEKKNLDLVHEILEAERQQIVAWAFKGLETLVQQQYKFKPTEKILNLTMEQKAQTSSAIQFFRDCVVQTPHEEERMFSKKRLFKVYKEWCKDEGRMATARSRFFDEIKGTFKLNMNDKYWVAASKTYNAIVCHINLSDDAQKEYVNIEQ